MSATSGQLKFGDCCLDLGSHELVRDGVKSLVEPKDLQVLLQLIEFAPNVVSSRELMRRNWPNAIVSDNSLYQSIGRLRRVMCDSARNPSYIQTVPKVGYRFIAPLDAMERSEPSLGPIAVLPFKDCAANRDYPFAVENLWHELGAELTRRGVDTVNRETAELFDIRTPAKEAHRSHQNVRHVLGGALMFGDGVLQVAARLGDLELDRLIFARTYCVEQAQLPEALRSVSRRLVSNLVADTGASLDCASLDIVPRDTPVAAG